MSEADPGASRPPAVFQTVIATCLRYGLLVSLAMALSVTRLNVPLRTLPDLLIVLVYLALFYGLASVALGAVVASTVRFLWPARTGRPSVGEDLRSLAAASFVGFGAFFYLGSRWRYQVAVEEGGSFLAPPALAKLAVLALTAIVLGWLFYRLHQRFLRRLSKNRRVVFGGLLTMVALWLTGHRYTLGSSSAAEEPPSQPIRVERTGTKVLLVAVDGATWTTLDPLLRAGRLPTLERLVANGACGPLTTFEPTESPLIWTSIATGMTPAKHGIRDYVVTKVPGLHPSYLFSTVEASYPRFTGVRLAIGVAQKLGLIETLPVTSDLRRQKAIWNILGEAGFTVGVNGWWATWPAEEVNGYVVSEYVSLAPTTSEASAQSVDPGAEGLTHPPELYDEIRPLYDGLGERMERAEIAELVRLTDSELERLNGPYKSDEPLSNLKWVYQRDAAAYQSERLLMERFQPGFSTVYLRGLDIISHLFWQFVEPQHFERVDPELLERFGPLVDNYAVLVDSMIAGLLELVDENTTVFVVSDHGIEASGETPISGHHPNAPEGIVVVSGKNIRPIRLDGVSVLDIAPTILHLMGLPVSGQMDGRVVTELIEEAFLAKHPVREIGGYGTRSSAKAKPMAPHSRERIEQELEALGYLD